MKAKIIKMLENILKNMNIYEKIELTKSKNYGDFSTNIAMKIANKLQDSPINIANKIIKKLDYNFIKRAEVANPGFINIFVKNDSIGSNLEEIFKLNKDFGRGNQNKYINVEYVSANPTGFLHVGHARGAVLGSILTNVLKFAGNKVDQEYYINDAGVQMNTLGEAVWTRYQQEFGKKIQMPKETYNGQDIVVVAKQIKEKFNDKFVDVSYKKCAEFFKEESKKRFLEFIKKHLQMLDISMDIYFSEQSLYKNNLIKKTLDSISKYTYTKDGALWLNTISEGDDKDRVLLKKDQTYTYIAPDIAYHKHKLDKGYDELINIWGGDHIGYIKRMEIALKYLGLPPEKLDIITVQMVRLVKNNIEIKMSKRLGTSFTLKELIELVGKDAARFWLIQRSNNSQLDFDVDKINKKSSNNPIFTIQYTYARICQLLKNTSKKSIIGSYQDKEKILINLLLDFPKLINDIANNHKVHLLPKYLIDLSRIFNSFYSNTKIINTNREKELLSLVQAVKIVIANGLKIIGIDSPEKM